MAGQDLPEWVQRYLAEDIPGIELMPQYQDSYVFVGEALGTNNKALEQWAAGFTVAQDLPQLVAVRVQARLTAAVSGSPDVAYGRYFEQVIKGAADIRYTGARKETDFWLLKRYTGEDDGADRDIYAFYVLVGIDKTALREQLNTILNGVQTDLTREQSAAITRLRDNFYNGF
ncbi:MAG: hypothetical protein LBQ55_01895 [Treponema sp.]|nr:hypothetical protein [Treponema sp.]